MVKEDISRMAVVVEGLKLELKGIILVESEGAGRAR